MSEFNLVKDQTHGPSYIKLGMRIRCNIFGITINVLMYSYNTIVLLQKTCAPHTKILI